MWEGTRYGAYSRGSFCPEQMGKHRRDEGGGRNKEEEAPVQKNFQCDNQGHGSRLD